jgi:hypothetical protein
VPSSAKYRSAWNWAWANVTTPYGESDGPDQGDRFTLWAFRPLALSPSSILLAGCHEVFAVDGQRRNGHPACAGRRRHMGQGGMAVDLNPGKQLLLQAPRTGRRVGPVGCLAAALLFSVPAHAGAAAVSNVLSASSSHCSAVLFVGVRGSGDGPGTFSGYAKTVWEVREAFRRAVRPQATISYLPLDYPAYSVTTLLTNPHKYFGGVQSGISDLTAALGSREKACPHQLVVLAGFSSGAMVVNRTLVGLGKKRSRLLAKIASVELLADPQRVATDRYNMGTGDDPPFNGLSIWAHGVSFPGVKLGSIGFPADSLPSSVQGETDGYCHLHDEVCSWDPNRGFTHALVTTAFDEAIARNHTHYSDSGAAANAASQAVRRVLPRLPKPPTTTTTATTTTTVPPPPPNTAHFVLSSDSGDRAEGDFTFEPPTTAANVPQSVRSACGGPGTDRNLYVPFTVRFTVTSSLPVQVDLHMDVTQLGFGAAGISTDSAGGCNNGGSLYWSAATPHGQDVGQGWFAVFSAVTPNQPQGDPALLRTLYAVLTAVLGDVHPMITLTGERAVQCRDPDGGIIGPAVASAGRFGDLQFGGSGAFVPGPLPGTSLTVPGAPERPQPMCTPIG